MTAEREVSPDACLVRDLGCCCCVIDALRTSLDENEGVGGSGAFEEDPEVSEVVGEEVAAEAARACRRAAEAREEFEAVIDAPKGGGLQGEPTDCLGEGGFEVTGEDRFFEVPELNIVDNDPDDCNDLLDDTPFIIDSLVGVGGCTTTDWS